MELDADDTQWAIRSDMWRTRTERATARRTKRAKPVSALTLAGHGVSMRIEGGALTIQNGFTHYPQRPDIIRYFKGDISLPERIVLLDGSGSVSFDVLSWLAEQKVSLIRINWKGDVVCVAGASGYSANPFRVRWQWETRETPAERNEFCRSIIMQKIEASIVTLEKSIRRSDKWERAMKSAYLALSRLDESPPEDIVEFPIAPRPTFEAGSAFRLNGEARAADRFPTIGVSSVSVRRLIIWPAIVMRRTRSMRY
jgi:CRISPR-associated protein Cas1